MVEVFLDGVRYEKWRSVANDTIEIDSPVDAHRFHVVWGKPGEETSTTTRSGTTNAAGETGATACVQDCNGDFGGSAVIAGSMELGAGPRQALSPLNQAF